MDADEPNAAEPNATSESVDQSDGDEVSLSSSMRDLAAPRSRAVIVVEPEQSCTVVYSAQLGGRIFLDYGSSWEGRFLELNRMSTIDHDRRIFSYLRRLVFERASGRPQDRSALAADAAWRARTDFLNSHPDVGYEAIRRFLLDVLEMSASPSRVEALIDVLLDDDWIIVPPELDEQLLRQLRQSTTSRHRGWRPITETQLHGRPIVSLSTPTPTLEDPSTTLGELVRATDDVERAVLLLPHQWSRDVLRVLQQLTSDEYAVALAYAEESGGTTWADAAADCDKPASFGHDRVRRKIRRLGQQHQKRQQVLAGTN